MRIQTFCGFAMWVALKPHHDAGSRDAYKHHYVYFEDIDDMATPSQFRPAKFSASAVGDLTNHCSQTSIQDNDPLRVVRKNS
ncbi:hypothetical protein AXG89_41725 (plasmid) [Burkholderia sp. PAMC 26561]|nr:hypothetical protein AXG89_41725 [Burkholderia sp. PAMC 26561]